MLNHIGELVKPKKGTFSGLRIKRGEISQKKKYRIRGGEKRAYDSISADSFMTLKGHSREKFSTNQSIMNQEAILPFFFLS